MIKNRLPKEISWLSFNERVLQEAGDDSVPIGDRVSFLGIYSNNLDEYFRVRVATLKRLARVKNAEQMIGYDPQELIREINKIVIDQNQQFEKTFESIIEKLASINVIVNRGEAITEEQEDFVKRFFDKEVWHRLMPIIINDKTRLPDLVDDSIYFGIHLTLKDDSDLYAILKLPTDEISRFVQLPSEVGKKHIMLLDDVVRMGLPLFFAAFNFKQIEAYTFKVTRDAELDLSDDLSDSYIEQMSKSLEQRKKAYPVRFVFDKRMPNDLKDVLMKLFNIKPYDVFIPGGKYHNFKDFLGFPKVYGSKNKYPALKPLVIPELQRGTNMFKALKKRDHMLTLPYHTFDHFLDLLMEASIDPKVKSIKITSYRLARESNVVKALMNAASNGKEVTAVIELQARFDEVANIDWSREMNEGGVKVIYGVKGLKVHSKLCQITRMEKGSLKRYCTIGTGNFNEDTAKVYTDSLLMTADVRINNDVEKIFDFLEHNFKRYRYNHLLVAPYFLRRRIMTMIQNEIDFAKAGKKAFIYIKLNNLVDNKAIDKLVEAAEAGVEVVLLIRGMFSMKPENTPIKAYAIVDRFLEHNRVLIFGNGGNELTYISSSDFMARNFDRRVEVACPIYDRQIAKQLKDMFVIHMNDNSKSRLLDDTQSNQMVRDGKADYNAQMELYKYLKKEQRRTK
jgi:polyphosphate kinase